MKLVTSLLHHCEAVFDRSITAIRRQRVDCKNLNFSDSNITTVQFRICCYGALAIIATALVWTNLVHSAQVQTTIKTGSAMKHFVFVFRQNPTIKLSVAEQEHRTEEVRAWALKQISDGRKLEPRILTPESHKVGQAVADGEESVIALNFIEAKDSAEAVRIAETHPGLHYGVSIEVREWTSPLPQPSLSLQ